MSGKVAKRIRTLMGLQKDDPTMNRKYKAIKTEYSRLNEPDKKRYLQNLEKLFSAGVNL